LKSFKAADLQPQGCFIANLEYNQQFDPWR